MSAKRFRIAFSFAGEKRDFVAQVAAILAGRLGEDKILYDKYHEAEFAEWKLGLNLPDLYRDQSDLIVVIVCPNYSEKNWCGLEWVAIHGMLMSGKSRDIMLCRFGHAKLQGLYENAGYVELDDKTPEQTTTLILQRLAINEGKPKSYYTAASAPPTATPQVIAVHLHPDFSSRLMELLEVWNSSQTRLAFTPVRPPEDIEALLLSGDPIEGKMGQQIAGKTRQAANFDKQVGIVLFCEGRLFGDGFYQLFSWTTNFGKTRLDASMISLFIKRELAKSGQAQPSLFEFVVQSVLYALGTACGLPQHEVTRTCIMDFDNEMSDMSLGLERGPRFCPPCEQMCRELKKEHLLELAAAAKLFARSASAKKGR